MIDRTISHFQVVSRLGAGGMGVVYRAVDTRLERPVALKFLPEHLSADGPLKERLLREARAASALDHPNICRVHSVEETEDGQLFIVMAYYEGQTLEALLREGPLPFHQVADLGGQIARGLAEAHGRGIVHRDLKPANTLVTSEGEVKIVDFGLARIQEATNLTVTGTALGTLPYMSPEQASGQEANPASDVWALGAVLYEMVTGSRPFHGETNAAVLYRILQEDPEPPSALRPDVPAELEGCILRCLEKDPADRWASAAQVADALERAGTGVPGTGEGAVSGPGGAGAGDQGDGVPIVPPGPPGPGPGEAGRRFQGVGWVGLGAGGAALALLLAVLFLFVGNRPGEATPDPSVAVLPLQVLGPDPDDAHLADALAEDLHQALSSVGGLRVTSIRTSMRYRGLDAPAAQIAQELGVRALLDGSVRPGPDGVGVSLRLIDAATDGTLWSSSFDVPRDGLSGIEAQVVRAVAQALQVRLSREEVARLETPATDNPAAWELVRMARSRWTSTEAQVLEETAGLYRMALDLEPDLALARAELAFALYWMGGTEGLAKAWTEVRRALQIDSTLAMGHFVEGTLLLREGRLDEARRAFHQALAFDPNHYFAMNNLSIVEWEAGRFEESLLWARRALDRAPDEANNYYHVSVPLLELEVDEVTEPFLREGLKRETWVAGFGAMGPKPYPRIPLNLTTLHLLRGEVEEARAWLEQGLAVYPDDLELRSRETLILMATGSPEADSVLEARYAEGRGSPLSYAVVLRRRGEEARVDSLLAPLLTWTLDRAEAGFERPSLPVTIAQLYALKGEEDEALEWLERAYEAGYRRARWLQVLPQLESLRDHPRFQALVERMSRDVARMRARLDLSGLPGGG
jgi:eukaryotic-like serine/threonine-protein kinase